MCISHDPIWLIVIRVLFVPVLVLILDIFFIKKLNRLYYKKKTNFFFWIAAELVVAFFWLEMQYISIFTSKCG